MDRIPQHNLKVTAERTQRSDKLQIPAILVPSALGVAISGDQIRLETLLRQIPDIERLRS